MVIYIESFGMTKLHKDIAMKLMESVNNPDNSDQAVVKVCGQCYCCLCSSLLYSNC